jgi:hypothetical protein
MAELKAIPPNGPFNGYGGGPGCSGLTPSQTNGIYNAPNAGPRGKGAGANVAVFELTAWDTCFYGFGGDIEAQADIEQDLTIAPDTDSVLVYNAPNDETGQTELDEYATIANQDIADSISTSWGECEADAGLAYAQAENVIFEQMAAQGQSIFASSGDTGAFECIRDGTFSDHAPLEQLDPASTAVGDQHRRHLVRVLRPGGQPQPELLPDRGSLEHDRRLPRE